MKALVPKDFRKLFLNALHEQGQIKSAKMATIVRCVEIFFSKDEDMSALIKIIRTYWHYSPKERAARLHVSEATYHFNVRMLCIVAYMAALELGYTHAFKAKGA